MAKTTVVHVTDDLDGSKDATEIAFSYGGVDYTIDLSKKNAAALEKVLEPYLESATKARSKPTLAGRRVLPTLDALLGAVSGARRAPRSSV